METLILAVSALSGTAMLALLIELICFKLRGDRSPKHIGGNDPQAFDVKDVKKTHDFRI